MNDYRVKAFLSAHHMGPEMVSPARDAAAMAREMELGLAGVGGSMPMIPTYLSDAGEIPWGEPVAVIDAGGTNFRCALVRLDRQGYRVEELRKWKMPGTVNPVSWKEFIAFAADAVEPLMSRTDKIGFCFSYSADITPEMDGRVKCIDKEVVIHGCEGQLVGKSLLDELERRAVTGKKIVILNDTVAVLLGGLVAGGDRAGVSVGQVSGTGTNTCCSLPVSRIGKLGLQSDRRMIVNLESGMYDGIPRGDFDLLLDQESHNPGQKYFEKLTAGVYLGELCHRMLCAAADEGLLSEATTDKVRRLGWIDSAVIDAWASGEKLEDICEGEEDSIFVRELCAAMFERSARCMCTNLAAILLLSGEKQANICAEGSLVQKGRTYRPILEKLIAEELGGKMGCSVSFHIGNESTLTGSAAAALLNL